MKILTPLLLVTGVLLLASPAQAQVVLTPAAPQSASKSFPKLQVVPKRWTLSGNQLHAYEAGVDRTVFRSGKASGYLRSKTSDADGLASVMQRVNAEQFRGKRVRLSAYLKTRNVSGWSGAFMRVDGPDGKAIAFDNMQTRPLSGTSDWTRCEVVLNVPADASQLVFGVILHATGQVWIDEFRIEEVGPEVPVTDLISGKLPALQKPGNLDFEG